MWQLRRRQCPAVQHQQRGRCLVQLETGASAKRRQAGRTHTPIRSLANLYTQGNRYYVTHFVTSGYVINSPQLLFFCLGVRKPLSISAHPAHPALGRQLVCWWRAGCEMRDDTNIIEIKIESTNTSSTVLVCCFCVFKLLLSSLKRWK